MAIVSNPSNWQVMHSALGDAYMVLNKSLMDDCKIPRKELERIIGGIKKAMRVQKRNCDTDKDVKKLLEEYIAMRGFTSDNQIRALYELALPVIEWLLEPTEKMKGESR